MNAVFARRTKTIQQVAYQHIAAMEEDVREAREIVANLQMQIDQGCRLGAEHLRDGGARMCDFRMESAGGHLDDY